MRVGQDDGPSQDDRTMSSSDVRLFGRSNIMESMLFIMCSRGTTQLVEPPKLVLEELAVVRRELKFVLGSGDTLENV